MIKTLVENLAYDNITLSQALTRAKIIAFKIDNETFQIWLKKELEGYNPEEVLPDYRRLNCDVNITIGNQQREQTLPVSFDNWPELKEIINVTNEIRSISIIEENYSALEGETGYIPFALGLIPMLEKTLMIRERYGMRIIRGGQHVNKLLIKRIIDLTRQKLIDTLLQLDKEFPDLDDDFRMTKDKGEKIQNIITNNIYGNNNPLNIAAGERVEQKDFIFNLTSNFSKLAEFGVSEYEIKELQEIFEKNSADQPTLTSKAMKWLGAVTASVTTKGLSDQIPAIIEFVHTHFIK